MVYIFKINFYIKVETKGNVIDGLLKVTKKGAEQCGPNKAPKPFILTVSKMSEQLIQT